MLVLIPVHIWLYIITSCLYCYLNICLDSIVMTSIHISVLTLSVLWPVKMMRVVYLYSVPHIWLLIST